MPSNSLTLGPSYGPMVTSKRFPSLFLQGFSLLNKSDFPTWYIVHMFSLLTSVIPFGKLSALVNRLSEVDG